VVEGVPRVFGELGPLPVLPPDAPAQRRIASAARAVRFERGFISVNERERQPFGATIFTLTVLVPCIVASYCPASKHRSCTPAAPGQENGTSAMTFFNELASIAERVEAALEELLKGELVIGVPPRLVSAMRHAVLGGGKRLRPFLVVESAKLFDIDVEKALVPALAVELIHGYSLVHDDLPAMDNDVTRRGRPTVWAEFDEWTAILVGDGLQSLAFEMLAAEREAIEPDIRLRLVRALSAASGVRGMVGGQALDLAAEKLGRAPVTKVEDIHHLQIMKTGELIEFSCVAGAILAGASQELHAALRSYGRHIGYAFQIADDILDAEGDAVTVGKAVAKDAEAGKATLVSLMGIEVARAALGDTVSKANAALAPFGARAETLRAAAQFVAERDR
jgi:farnesyl diphosphate synthase